MPVPAGCRGGGPQEAVLPAVAGAADAVEEESPEAEDDAVDAVAGAAEDEDDAAASVFPERESFR